MVDVMGIQAAARDGGGTASTSRLLQLGVIWQVELWHWGSLMLCMLDTEHEQKERQRLESPSCSLSLEWLKSLAGNLGMTSFFLLSRSLSVITFFLFLPSLQRAFEDIFLQRRFCRFLQDVLLIVFFSFLSFRGWVGGGF
jgi:hypothetical protein